MTATKQSNIAEIKKLEKQVAKTGPSQSAFAELLAVAESAQAGGIDLRKGSSGKSSRNGEVHVYASRNGVETRIWSEDRMRAGYFAPLTAPKIQRLIDAIRKLA
jgi:hypothetical protein